MATAKFDLTLALHEPPQGGLAGELEYNADLFEPATVERLLGHLGTLLAGDGDGRPGHAASRTCRCSARPSGIGFGGGVERDRGAGAGDDRCTALFAAQAARTPEATALVFEGETLTYARARGRPPTGWRTGCWRTGVGPGTIVGRVPGALVRAAGRPARHA